MCRNQNPIELSNQKRDNHAAKYAENQPVLPKTFTEISSSPSCFLSAAPNSIPHKALSFPVVSCPSSPLFQIFILPKLFPFSFSFSLSFLSRHYSARSLPRTSCRCSPFLLFQIFPSRHLHTFLDLQPSPLSISHKTLLFIPLSADLPLSTLSYSCLYPPPHSISFLLPSKPSRLSLAPPRSPLLPPKLSSPPLSFRFLLLNFPRLQPSSA